MVVRMEEEQPKINCRRQAVCTPCSKHESPSDANGDASSNDSPSRRSSSREEGRKLTCGVLGA